MLVLRRKAGEAIVLNGVITIHVLAVEGERVKLGISAPPEVVIVRSELLEHQGQAAVAGHGMAAPSPLTREGPRPFREGDPGRGPGGAGGMMSGGEDGASMYTPEAPSPYSGPNRYVSRRQPVAPANPAESAEAAPITRAPSRYS